MTELQVASDAWTPPKGTLGELTRSARLRADALAETAGSLERSASRAPLAPSFAAAIRRQDVAVIGELKKRSPSRGLINDAFDLPARARSYTAAGAAALSIVTEPERFGGSLDDLRAARAASTLPLLRKDFIVDRLQLLEARAAGASAVLLIARALSPSVFRNLATEAMRLGLELLLEIRDERELDVALAIEGAVIGINNRNLETLALDDTVSERLVPRVPGNRVAVYESGIQGRAGVERAAELGADAILVGSLLSAASQGGDVLASLTGVKRRVRVP